MITMLKSKFLFYLAIIFLSQNCIFLRSAASENLGNPNQTILYHVNDVEWAQTEREFWVSVIGDSPPTYTVYELLNPTRVVIDIANATLDFQLDMDLSAENIPISSVKGEKLQDRDPSVARVEFVLSGDRSYNVEREGNDIYLVFPEKTQKPSKSTTTTTAPPSVSIQPITPAPTAPTLPTIPVSAAVPAEKASVIFDVKVDSTPTETMVRVRADGPIRNFEKAELGAASGKPPRMYIDIPDIRMPKLTRKQDISTSLAGIRIGRRNKGVRIVFDSAREALFSYSILTSPEGLIVTVNEGKTEAMSAIPDESEIQPIDTLSETESIAPPKSPELVAALQQLEAKKTAQKEKTTNKVEMPKQGLPIVTELIQPIIPSKSQSIPNIKEARTSTTKTDTATLKKPIKPTEKPAITDEYGFTGYQSQRITVDFFKVDLHNVFRLFGEISSRNIVIDEGVNGSLTLALKDVPWDFALDIILNLKDLQKEEQFNTIVISPKSKNFNWPERASKKIAFKTEDGMDAEALSIKKRDTTSHGQVESQKLLIQAQVKEREGDFPGAMTLYESAYNKWPANTQLAKRIASIALVNLGLNAKGAYYAEMSLKQNPTDYDAALLAAIGYANLKKIKKAKEFFDLAISGPHPTSEALTNYATFCEEYQSHEAALNLYDKHQEIYGFTLPIMIGKARVFDKKGQSEKAQEEYRAILNSGFELPADLQNYIQARLAINK